MNSLCNPRSFRVLCLATGLAILALQNAASAGVLSYNSGTGGTFDPSSPSTFTFTGFPTGSLVPGKSYTDARVFVKWGGTTSHPGTFTISGISFANPSAPPLTDIQFLATTAAGAVRSNGFVTLGSTVDTDIFSNLGLTLTIPTLTVADGFFLEVAVQATDNVENTNTSLYQKVTAIAPVPEPSVGILAGCVASAIWYARRRRSMAA